MKTGEVLVIDLFAGPGGLGEGFSSITDADDNQPFKIGISIEKEASAHKTLTTRAFYRKIKDVEDGLYSYNRYLDGQITREQLFKLFPAQANEAQQETLHKPHALGIDNAAIHQRIQDLVTAHGDNPKIVIGGPPCQAYSLAGRSRNAGIKDYKAEEDHRNFLYKEYLNVLSIAKPDVFVMENVRGILSAKIAGELMFPRILQDLQSPSRVTNTSSPKYKIFSLVVPAKDSANPTYNDTSDFLIKMENFGIPQARHRVILLGVRDDLNGTPNTLVPHAEHATVEQVLSDLPKLRSGFSKRKDNPESWEAFIQKNSLIIKGLLEKRFPDINTLDLTPLKNLPRSIHQVIETSSSLPSHLLEWYRHNAGNHVLNHETRTHIDSDLLRYAYSAAFTSLNNGVSPKARDFPDLLSPAHENWKSGIHSDRFRTQAANKYSTTVTSHISKDGHYFIHYDAQQCRSLTVREAARLQTFPDNYLFEGNRTQQYVQVGNAVPPYLAFQIGHLVLELLSTSKQLTPQIVPTQ